MDLKIRKIAEAGNLEKERVVFDVLEDVFLGGFIVFKSMAKEEKVSSTVESAYWFPDKEIKKGDVIALYSKRGIDFERLNPENSTTTRFFYWGKDSALWKDSDDAVVLVEATAWNFESLASLGKKDTA
jgi:hypothetical protein